MQVLLGLVFAPLSLELQFVNNHLSPSSSSTPSLSSPIPSSLSTSLPSVTPLTPSHHSHASPTSFFFPSFMTSNNDNKGGWLGIVNNNWSSSISHNLFTQFNHGTTCILFGKDGEPGDLCSYFAPTLGILFICYILSQFLSSFSLLSLMSQTQQKAVVPLSLTTGVGLALAAFTIPVVQQWMPGHTAHTHTYRHIYWIVVNSNRTILFFSFSLLSV